MENSTYLQRLKTFIRGGLKVGALPALLINTSFALVLSFIINAMEPSWDFTLGDGVFLTAINTILFASVSLTGIILIGSALALWKKGISSVLATFLGLIVGAIPLIVGNYILWKLFFLPAYQDFDTFIGEFLIMYFLPNIAIILILTRTAQKMIRLEIS